MALKFISLPRQLVSRSAVRSQGNREGSILIIALWSLCLLATFAVILGYEVRQKLTLIQRLDERDKLYLISEAGIKKAIVQIKKEKPENNFTLNNPLSNNASLFKDMEIDDGKANICYNYYIEGEPARWETRYGVSDEESKININKISLPVLDRLFRIVLGFGEIEASELAAAIIDWRDSDSELSIPAGSAEDPYYRNLDYPYEAKDADFEVLEEVTLVKGITEGIFRKIENYITIYGDGKVNINTASQPVFLALGLNREIVDKILNFRCGEDGLEGTLDDNVFDTQADIVPRLSQIYHLNDAEISQLSSISERYFVTNSEYFMIESVAKLNNKKNASTTTCVVDRSGKILSWQES